MEMNDVVSERGEEGMGGLGRGWAGRGGVVLVTRRVCLTSLEFTPSDQMGGAMGGGRTGGSMPGKDKVGALSKDDSRGEIGTNTTITTVAAAFSAANSTTCAATSTAINITSYPARRRRHCRSSRSPRMFPG